jgi:hypothetical protein
MVLLVLDSPQNDPGGQKAKTLASFSRVLARIFFIEAILRASALGFFTTSLPGRKAYITFGGNQIDFFISVVIEVVIWSASEFDVLNKDNAGMDRLEIE